MRKFFRNFKNLNWARVGSVEEVEEGLDSGAESVDEWGAGELGEVAEGVDSPVVEGCEGIVGEVVRELGEDFEREVVDMRAAA